MDSDYANLKTLGALNHRIQGLISNAEGMDATSDNGGQDPWEVAYDLVFSDAISRQVYSTLRAMNQSLDYYDPDTSYEEDVRAFADAVYGKFSVLERLLDNGPTVY